MWFYLKRLKEAKWKEVSFSVLVQPVGIQERRMVSKGRCGDTRGQWDECNHNRLCICIKPPQTGRDTGYCFFLNKNVILSSSLLLKEQLIKQYARIQCELGFYDVWFCNCLGLSLRNTVFRAMPRMSLFPSLLSLCYRERSFRTL